MCNGDNVVVAQDADRSVAHPRGHTRAGRCEASGEVGTLMENAPLRIIVDDRERADGKVLAALAARDDVTVEIARLEVGDYRVERRVVVERKTVADFAASLIDGRLFQ